MVEMKGTSDIGDHDIVEDANRNRHRSDENEQKQSAKIDVQPTYRSKSQENLTFKHSMENITKPIVKHKTDNDVVKKSCDHFKLIWQRSFACPVMGVDRVDIMGDGMEDLIVVTLKGVHIIQVIIITIPVLTTQKIM
jgi:hypothetical protein